MPSKIIKKNSSEFKGIQASTKVSKMEPECLPKRAFRPPFQARSNTPPGAHLNTQWVHFGSQNP